MTCREFAEFILDHLSGELPQDRAEAFEHHLTRCENCTRYLAQYRATVSLERQAFADPDGPVPADAPDDLVRAILAARER